TCLELRNEALFGVAPFHGRALLIGCMRRFELARLFTRLREQEHVVSLLGERGQTPEIDAESDGELPRGELPEKDIFIGRSRSLIHVDDHELVLRGADDVKLRVVEAEGGAALFERRSACIPG